MCISEQSSSAHHSSPRTPQIFTSATGNSKAARVPLLQFAAGGSNDAVMAQRRVQDARGTESASVWWGQAGGYAALPVGDGRVVVDVGFEVYVETELNK